MIRDDRQKDGSQEGAALIGTVMVMLILSMLGTVSMNLAALEIESVGAARDEAVARHLAEAGADLAVQWFHDPQSAPIGTDGSLLGSVTSCVIPARPSSMHRGSLSSSGLLTTPIWSMKPRSR